MCSGTMKSHMVLLKVVHLRWRIVLKEKWITLVEPSSQLIKAWPPACLHVS